MSAGDVSWTTVTPAALAKQGIGIIEGARLGASASDVAADMTLRDKASLKRLHAAILGQSIGESLAKGALTERVKLNQQLNELAIAEAALGAVRPKK